MAPSPPVQGESAYEASEWFRAFDHTGTKGLYLEGVYRIREHMMDTSRWGLTRRSSRVSRQPKCRSPSPNTSNPPSSSSRKRSRNTSDDTTPSSKKPKSSPTHNLLPEALTLLAPPPNPPFPEYYCLNCKLPPNNPSCTPSCHTSFRATHFTPTPPKLQIRATSPPGGGTGLGVFVLPGEELPQDAWLGEYLGELLPPTAPEADSSNYAFTLPAAGEAGAVVIDAGTHGNWTRFVNSSCKPNVVASPEQVGGVRMVVFRTTREIKGGEQVVIGYGRGYFEGRGMMCCCGEVEGEHLPEEEEEVKGGKKKGKARRGRKRRS